MTTWHEWLKENLRPDQFERLDAYDVEILACLYTHKKRSVRLYTLTSTIYQHLRLEMGGITAVEFDEHTRKLEDMALIRRQVVFNREMPEDLG